MKRQYFKTIAMLLLVAVLAPMRVAAIEFTVNGINYKSTLAWEVEVVAPAIGDYEGAIVIPGSVTYDGDTYRVTGIGSEALKGPGITSVTLPAGTIRTIGEKAFYDCHNLTSFVIPASVTQIYPKAFYDCYHLKDLYFCTDDPPTIDPDAFTGVNTSENTCTLHVPAGRKYYYQYTSAFDTFTNYAEWDAPEIYGLTVAGCLVTADNKADVLGDGKVTYNTTTTTLTIGTKIVTTEPNQSIVYNSHVDGLTILFDNCSLTASNVEALHLERETTLKGTATIEGNNYAVESSSEVAIIDATLNFNGVITSSNSSVLNIKNSNVTAVAPNWAEAAIMNFDDVLLTDCFFLSPVDAKYEYGKITSFSGGDTNSIVIKAGEPQSYNLWVAGTQVTELNCDDILGGYEARYDPTKNELTIAGPVTAIQSYGHEQYAIDSEIPGLTILVVDNLTVSSDNSSAIRVVENTIIKGYSLTIMAPKGYGIEAPQGKLTIKDANILLNYCRDGIFGVDDWLKIEYASVEGYSTSGKAVIRGFSDVSLTDCLYKSPDGVFYDNDSRQLMDINGNVATSVEIGVGNQKDDTNLAFPREAYLATYGKAFTAPELKNPENVAVTYSSSNTDVATVASTGAVTIKGRGMTVISAVFAGTAEYNPKRVSYYLVVTNSEGLQYDANQDGTVTIADAVDVVNAIITTNQ